jgi:hypothetical protein
MRSRSHLVLVLVSSLLANACRDSAPLTAPEAIAPSLNAIAAFDPQPDPPFKLAFVAVGPLDGRWAGSVDKAPRTQALEIETLSSTRVGGISSLVQRWTIYPPSPTKPLSIGLKGTLDLRTGELVMTGATTDGTRVNEFAKGTLSSNGGLSIGGDVMFNPQPDPPREWQTR